MKQAEVACIHCRRRKIACSRKLPSCTECLIHGRDCCYNRDKRRRIESKSPPHGPTASHATGSRTVLPQQNMDIDACRVAQSLSNDVCTQSTDMAQVQLVNSDDHQSQRLAESASQSCWSSSADDFDGAISDALNDPFLWLALQWPSPLGPDSAGIQALASNSGVHSSHTVCCDESAVEGGTAPFLLNGRYQDTEELRNSYKRCLPDSSQWPKLFSALRRLCDNTHIGSEPDLSPFLSLSKLHTQLELDATATSNIPRCASSSARVTGPSELLNPTISSDADSSHAQSISQQHGSAQRDLKLTSVTQPGMLRRAWTLAAICLAKSASAVLPIDLPSPLCLQHDHKLDVNVRLFSAAWAHCHAGLYGDPIEVLQTYRMMSLAFSRCRRGTKLAAACVFLGSRAAAAMSLHRSETIASLGSSMRQQEALNAFWHLVSQGCHFQAWEGRDMPIDMGLVDLTMPDLKSFLQHPVAQPCSNSVTEENPASHSLPSSPIFMTRIWTSVAIGQTIERHYRQDASILVPCEKRLKVAVPLAIRPSQQEQEHVKQTTEALDYCASLLQMCNQVSTETREGQLKRFVLMLVRYSRVLLHYPFCRVDRDHRRAAQESISAIIATVLGTLHSLACKQALEPKETVSCCCKQTRQGTVDEDSDGDSSGSNESAQGHCSVGARQSIGSSQPAQHAESHFTRMDGHLLELLAGMSVRALVFTLALIKHPMIVGTSQFSSTDDSERQKSDVVLALRALEQLHEYGVVSRSLLRRACKIASRDGQI